MKRTLAVLTLGLTVFILAGCSGQRQPVDDTPVSVPAASDQPETAALPALPLWPQPGVRLLDGKQDWSPGYSFRPFEVNGQEFRGIATPEGIYYVRQEGDAVYLVGSLTERGGLVRRQSPKLLYRLPVKPGDQWETPDGTTHVVRAVEKVKTPAGEQLAARIEVKETYQDKPLSQWWVPGYGLVMLERDSWAATREIREEPRQTPDLGRPAPGITALLEDDGQRWYVTDLKSGQELFQVEDSYWRSWYGWQSVGEFDLLDHAHFPGSWGIYGYDAYRFHSQSGQFKTVRFVAADGSEVHPSGTGRWMRDGAFKLSVFQRYPARYYIFRWDGTVMRSDPKAERPVWAESGEELVRQLFTTPPLPREDFANAFLNAEDSQRLYELIPDDIRFGAGADVEADPASPGVFVVRDGYGKSARTLATLRVTQQDGRFYIASFEWIAEPEPIGLADKELLGLRLESMMLPEVEELLGPPAEPTVSGPGGYGYDRVYRGGEVTVHYVGGGWDAVWAVTLKGEGKTPRGIGLGSTREQVLKAYPEPVHDEPEYLEFWDEGRLGYFFIRFYFDESEQVREILLSRHK